MVKEINIQKHVVVPKHEIMKKEQAELLLKKLNIIKGQLPKISIKDVMVKLLEAEEDDIIKVTRQSETNVKSIYYRVVINE